MGAKKYNTYVSHGEFTEIVLDKGLVALVDTDVLPLIEKYCWYARLQKVSGRYYAATNTLGGREQAKNLFLHVLIMGEIEGKFVDHRTGKTLDNRRANLRHVTRAENEQNRTVINKNSSTGVRGVSRWALRGCLRAMVTAGGRTYCGGNFPDTPEGLAAAEQAAIALRMRYHTHSDGR